MQHEQYDQRGGGYPPGYPPQQPPPQYPGYPQQPYPPQYQPQYQPPGYGYKKPMEPPELAWLWMSIGIFFFVSFFIPFSSDPMFFIWDCPGIMIFFFATAMVMGIGIPIVAYVVPKFIRMIVLLSMGAFGLLSFTIFQGQRAGAGGTFLALSSFAFVGAYIANESRLKYPYNFLSRLLGGICGGALALFVVLGELLQITQTGYFTGMNAMRVISFILMLLASLTLAGAGVILLVNLAVRPDSSKLAKLSRLLLQIGMLVLLGWPLIGEPVSMLIDFSFAAGLWTFFFVLRISGFVLGYMILLGFWLYKLLDLVSFQKFPGQPPVYPQYPPAGAGQPPGYGPQGGYGPPQGGYGPPQGGYGPPQGGYGPPQGGYGPPQGGYGPPQGGYGPPQGGYGPPQGGYGPPQGGGWPPPGGGQPPPGQ